MKALDFLKEQQQRHKNMAKSMNLVYFDDELDEAITELEEIMKPKTCSTCYWWNDFYTQCNDHDNSMAGVSDYCCNRHELKE